MSNRRGYAAASRPAAAGTAGRGGRAPAPQPPRREFAWFALLPLRAFLGFTFCFAGLQKLANPAFFDPNNPASIHAQLVGAARRSPIHALITPLLHHAGTLGALIAFAELAVGIGALTGLLTRLAALGGALLSLSLFLAVSFHTSPYYTGSDIVFFFGWLPLIVAGGGPLSLDAWAAREVAARRRRMGDPSYDVQRRRLVGALVAGVGAVAFAGAGTVAGLGRLFHTSSPSTQNAAQLGAGAGPSGAAVPPSSAGPTSVGSAAPGAAATTPAATRNSPAAGGNLPAGTKIGPASAVPVAGAAAFTDPTSGDPALVIQPRRGTFRAFDAVCPHAGCTVEYDPGSSSFVCPCHGSQFSAKTGAVMQGPARRSLGSIAIAEGGDGNLYVQ